MSETMEFHYRIFETLPLWDHDIAGKIVETVLWDTWDSKLYHGVINLKLGLGGVCLDEVAFHEMVNVISMLTYLRASCPEI